MSVIHPDHLEDIDLHVKSHLDSSWSLGCCNFKPQPSYCGVSNNRTMFTLSTIVYVCGYFKQCNKSGCVAQAL